MNRKVTGFLFLGLLVAGTYSDQSYAMSRGLLSRLPNRSASTATVKGALSQGKYCSTHAGYGLQYFDRFSEARTSLKEIRKQTEEANKTLRLYIMAALEGAKSAHGNAYNGALTGGITDNSVLEKLKRVCGFRKPKPVVPKETLESMLTYFEKQTSSVLRQAQDLQSHCRELFIDRGTHWNEAQLPQQAGKPHIQQTTQLTPIAPPQYSSVPRGRYDNPAFYPTLSSQKPYSDTEPLLCQ